MSAAIASPRRRPAPWVGVPVIGVFFFLNSLTVAVGLLRALYDDDAGDIGPVPEDLVLLMVSMLLQSMLVAWVRTRVAEVFVLGTLLHSATLLLLAADAVLLTPSYFFLVLAYTAQPSRTRQRALLIGALVLALLTAAIGILRQPPTVHEGESASLLWSCVLGVCGAFVLAVFLGGWHRSTVSVTERDAREAPEHGASPGEPVRSALMHERRHIARELHDVAAHHLTTILVQSKAALTRRPVDATVAEEALGLIAVESEHAVRNMNVIVRVLREGAEGAAPPRFRDLGLLVQTLVDGESRVRLDITGELGTLAEDVALACYRIVQEGLTNARRYAPDAPVRVAIRRSAQQVCVEVFNGASEKRDDLPHLPGGYGIIGMQERVQALGGSLRHGPLDNGGWCVRATIPLLAGRTPV